MSSRHADWFRQAEADLRHARNSAEAGDYEWACFAAQQAPTDYYTAEEAEAAIADASEIMEFCSGAMG